MKFLIYTLAVIALASSSFARAEEETGITAVVIKGDGGDVPKVCYYDPEAAKQSGDWNDGLLGCDPALIGKASTPTPTSPPEGFGVLFHKIEANRRTGYTCSDFAQVTEEGVGIHCVIGTKARQEALRHPTPENTRVTNGCINVPTNGLFRKYSDRIKLVHIR